MAYFAYSPGDFVRSLDHPSPLFGRFQGNVGREFGRCRGHFCQALTRINTKILGISWDSFILRQFTSCLCARQVHPSSVNILSLCFLVRDLFSFWWNIFSLCFTVFLFFYFLIIRRHFGSSNVYNISK